METFRKLVHAVHATGLKLILDYIPNHTSDQHPWFKESRSSRSNPRRDWFIWRDPAADGTPPNNWRSVFGGPAWARDDLTEQYYYHAFLACQPDLNWRNPDVVGAMLDVLRYWLDEGVDGFRVDAIHHLIEDEGLTDNPVNPFWRVGMDPAEELIPIHTVDLPEVHDPVARMRRVLDGYDGERVLIGEAYLPIDQLVSSSSVSLANSTSALSAKALLQVSQRCRWICFRRRRAFFLRRQPMHLAFATAKLKGLVMALNAHSRWCKN